MAITESITAETLDCSDGTFSSLSTSLDGLVSPFCMLWPLLLGRLGFVGLLKSEMENQTSVGVPFDTRSRGFDP